MQIFKTNILKHSVHRPCYFKLQYINISKSVYNDSADAAVAPDVPAVFSFFRTTEIDDVGSGIILLCLSLFKYISEKTCSFLGVYSFLLFNDMLRHAESYTDSSATGFFVIEITSL